MNTSDLHHAVPVRVSRAFWFSSLAAVATVLSLRAADNIPNNGVMDDAATSFIVDGTTRALGGTAVTLGSGVSGNQLTISNGGILSNSGANSVSIGKTSSSKDNIAVVTGDGSEWHSARFFAVGDASTGNSLTISFGGKVTVDLRATVGTASGSDGNSVLVTGHSSVFSVIDTLTVGQAGKNNILTISGGGTVSTGNTSTTNLAIGSQANATGNKIIVTGMGSTLSSANTIAVGVAAGSSFNALELLSGGVATAVQGLVGLNNTSNGNAVTLTGAGTTWHLASLLRIGYGTNNGNSVVIADHALLKLDAASLTVIANNYLRFDGGYLAVHGDWSAAFGALLETDEVQIYDGDLGWVTTNDLTQFSVTYVTAGEADTSSLTGGNYADLGGYTIISMATVIPEPSSLGLWGIIGVFGYIVSLRKVRC